MYWRCMMRPYSRRPELLVLPLIPLMLLACGLGEAPTLIPTSAPLPTLTPAVTATNGATTIPVQPEPGCTPRTDWPSITIAPGDTLSSIAAQIGSTVDELASANCISDPAAIIAGQSLYVPQLPGGVPTAIPGGYVYPTASSPITLPSVPTFDRNVPFVPGIPSLAQARQANTPGGVDVSVYCAALGFDSHPGNAPDGSPNAAFSWYCVDAHGRTYALNNWNIVCYDVYGEGYVAINALDDNHIGGWRCGQRQN